MGVALDADLDAARRGGSVLITHLDAGEFVALLGSPFAIDDLASAAGGAVVVSGSLASPPSRAILDAASVLPSVIIARSQTAHSMAELTDVFAQEQELDHVLRTVTANPQAATTLALLLRGGERRSVSEGLIAESAAFSTLQAGPEFERWHAAQSPRRNREDDGPTVMVDRNGSNLRVLLNRPHVRNALNTQLRDELYEALSIAAADTSLAVEISGSGSTFCSGGDLNEFGSRPDPPTAHLVRLTRSLGWRIHTIADRVRVEMHGRCAGSGVELAAFAAHISAHPETTFALPEVSLGLVPGAGGTVSLPARIGRHRTALLALSGASIDATTALSWGLIDVIGGNN